MRLGRVALGPYETHSKQLRMLSPPDLGLIYPPDSKYLTPQHFFQVGVQKWLARAPRPLTTSQMVQFGRHLSKQKVLASANHVSEELTIRFAHRVRQMQLLPYRLMSHPALLGAYEQYIDSFNMLQKLGHVDSLEGNEELQLAGQRLLLKHTRVVTHIVSALREIVSRPHKEGDAALLNELVTSLLTSRLSRRVLVKQHALLTQAWQNTHSTHTKTKPNMIGEVKLDCRIVDVLSLVEPAAKQYLSNQLRLRYGRELDPTDMPCVLVEGSENDLAATFPYIWPHFEFAFGQLLLNSLEACVRSGSTAPIVVTVSATEDSVLVRISDQGGGIAATDLEHVWSFAKPGIGDTGTITQRGLANHQFFRLLFPQEEDEVPGIEMPLGAQFGASLEPPVVPQQADQNARTDSAEPSEQQVEHLGLGLALARLYVEYWGGALELHSIEGFGCDAVMRVSRLGSKKENLRF